MSRNRLPQGATPFARLVDLMAILRSEHGCPWDREQTHQTLTPYLIEEAYEVLETIEELAPDSQDAPDPHDAAWGKFRDELGDLLLQVVFHAQLAREAAHFTIDDVATAIVEKMVRRHPHVFADAVANDSGEVLSQWEQLKAREKAEKLGGSKGNQPRVSLLDGIPRQLPALLAAERISMRAAEVGFRWDDPETALAKIHEEVGEALAAWKSGNKDEARDEMGDVLFAVANLCREMGIISEDALRGTNDKFKSRFAHIEAVAAGRGVGVKDLQRDEMLRLWEESKKHV